jgi:uncharacterized protein YhaN
VIRGWDIERFGNLHKYQVRNLPPGLIIVFGPNGSGKNTLRSFLSGMLFGFGPSQSSAVTERRYDRSEGGRVVLAGPNGEAVLERRAWNRFALHLNGKAATQRDLEELCGLPDLSSYRSIFVVEPRELDSFEPLAGTGLATRLFTTAGSEGEQLERRARRRLWRHASKTLRSEGGRGISDALDELEALGARLEETRKASNAHGELERQLRSFRSSVADLQGRVARFRAEQTTYETLLELWPAWRDRSQLQTELDQISLPENFPEDAAEQFHRLRSAISDAQYRLNETLAQEAELGRQLDEMPVAQPLEVRGDVEALVREIPEQVGRLQHGHQIDAEIAETERVQLNALSELPVLLARSIETTDIGELTRQIDLWQSALADGVARRRAEMKAWLKVRRRRVAFERSREVVSALLERYQPLSDAAIQETERLLRRVRDGLLALAQEQRRTTELEQTVAQYAKALRQPRERVRVLPAWVPLLGWCVTLAGGAGWAHTAMFGGFGIPPVVLVLLTAASFIAAEGSRYLRSHATTVNKQRGRETSSNRHGYDTAARNLIDHQKHSARLEFALGVDATRLGLPVLPTPRDLDMRQTASNEDKAGRRRWEHAAQARRNIGAKLVELDLLETRQRSGFADARRASRETVSQWHQWRGMLGLTGLTRPEEALQIVDRVRVAQERAQAIQHLRARRAALEDSIDHWESKVRTCLMVAEDEEGSTMVGEPLMGALTRLHQRCLQDEQTRVARLRLSDDLADFRERVRINRSRVESCAAAVQEFFDRVGAPSDAAFQSMVVAQGRREILTQNLRLAEGRLSDRLERSADAHALQQLLATGHPDEWREGLAGVRELLRRLDEEQVEVLCEQHKAETAAREAYDGARELPLLETRHAALRAELMAKVATWKTFVVAEALLTLALYEHRTDHQPPVLAQASRFYSAVTASRPQQVVQASGRTPITVRDANARMRPVDELGAVTREQLFVSLRLGAVSELRTSGSRLPLLMGDIFGHLDPNRARATAEVLAEIAGGGQVFLFTCRPETRDLLKRIDQNALTLEMGGREPRREFGVVNS